MFRYVQEGSVVRNLSVSGTVAPGGSKSQLGILAGLNYGKLENCQVSGRVTGAAEVGGMVGANDQELPFGGFCHRGSLRRRDLRQ